MKRPCLTYLFLSVLLPLLLVSCRKDPLPVSSQEAEQGSGVYVSIVVNTESGNTSRVPTPGEDGDGKQPGTGDENKVYDLNVFFFEGKTDSNGQRLGINSTDAEDIPVTCVYFTDLTPDPSGNITRYATPTQEVEGLQIGKTYDVLVVANYGRNMLEVSDISNLDKLRDYTLHAISEQSNGHHFRMSSSGPEVNTIEIIANNSPYNPATVSVDIERVAARVDVRMEEEYKVEGTTNDVVEILGATLVNKYNQPSYVFKRVTNGIDLSSLAFTYLGNEIGGQNTPVTNYVIDPKTLTPPTADFNTNYDNHFTALNVNDPNTWQLLNTTIKSEDQDGNTYYLLDYTQENVVSADVVSSDRAKYCTGIVFQAKYTPADESKIGEDGTFYWYDNQAFASLEDIQKYSSSVVAVTEDNYADYGIIKYTGGICYYTYWIRHADDGNPNVISPMEYAIVRNNIYQLDVKSISGIGSVIPQDNVDLNIRVFVCEWEPITTKEEVVWE